MACGILRSKMKCEVRCIEFARLHNRVSLRCFERRSLWLIEPPAASLFHVCCAVRFLQVETESGELVELYDVVADPTENRRIRKSCRLRVRRPLHVCFVGCVELRRLQQRILKIVGAYPSCVNMKSLFAFVFLVTSLMPDEAIRTCNHQFLFFHLPSCWFIAKERRMRKPRSVGKFAFTAAAMERYGLCKEISVIGRMCTSTACACTMIIRQVDQRREVIRVGT
eukprot:4158147-Pleurochrysis_carterae.AAC.1